MENDKHSILPETVLNEKYRIERIIGSGGMGAVYEATHVIIGRKVAIKTLHADFIKNESVLARFRREAELAGSIGHDNICEVTDFGMTQNGSPYLVMPLLKGASFAAVLEKHGILSPERLGDIIGQTLSALQAAHDAQIVHRDLKPENIFITRIGDRSDFVKLLDFGISKVLDQDSVLSLTRTGTVLGTPYYMSPEQAKGSKEVDHRSDIYATGVMIYEALTSKRPFDGESYNEVMFKIIAEPLPSPRELNPAISKGVERVILKAMSRDPELRYGDATAMRESLLRSLAGEAPAASIANMETEVLTEGASLPSPTGAKETQTPFATELPIKEQRNKSSRYRTVVPVLAGIIGVLVLGCAIAGYFVLRRMAEAHPPPIPVPLASPVGVEGPPSEKSDTKDTASNSSPLTQPNAEVGSSELDSRKEDPAKAASEQTEIPKKKRAQKSRRAKKRRTEKVVITPTGPSRVSLPPEEKPKQPKEKKEVEGRFGTKIVSDYDD